MSEFNYTTEETKEALVVNILPQETYDRLRELSADLLEGELSNQLFLTNGDAIVSGDVDGLPGEVVYCTNGGFTHGPVLIRNGYVCETAFDLGEVRKNAKQASGNTSEVNLSWNQETASFSKTIFPCIPGNQAISCAFNPGENGGDGISVGLVYGCYTEDDYGNKVGFGFFSDRKNGEYGTFLEQNGEISPISTLTGNHDSVGVVRTETFLCANFGSETPICVDISATILSDDPGDVGYASTSSLTVTCERVEPVVILSVDNDTRTGTAYRLNPADGSWGVADQTLEEAGYLPGRFYRNEATEKTFFLWDGKVVSIVGDQYATAAQLDTKLDISAAPWFRKTIPEWNPSQLSSVSDYAEDNNHNRKPTRNDFMIVWNAIGYNPNDYGQPSIGESLSGAWRFIYNQDSWDVHNLSGWYPQYRINEGPFSDAQMSAINSGIDASKVAKYDGYNAQIEARAYLSATSSDTQLSEEFSKYYLSSQTSSAVQISAALISELSSKADWDSLELDLTQSSLGGSVYVRGGELRYGNTSFPTLSVNSTTAGVPNIELTTIKWALVPGETYSTIQFEFGFSAPMIVPDLNGGTERIEDARWKHVIAPYGSEIMIYTWAEATQNGTKYTFYPSAGGTEMQWNVVDVAQGTTLSSGSFASYLRNLTPGTTTDDFGNVFGVMPSQVDWLAGVIAQMSELTKAVHYDFANPNVFNNVVNLRDRAINEVSIPSITADIQLTLPTTITAYGSLSPEYSYSVRDLLVRMEIPSAFSGRLIWSSKDGEDVIMETEDGSDPYPDTLTADPTTVLYSWTETKRQMTETAVLSSWWAVSMKPLVEVS